MNIREVKHRDIARGIRLWFFSSRDNRYYLTGFDSQSEAMQLATSIIEILPAQDPALVRLVDINIFPKGGGWLIGLEKSGLIQ